MEWGAHLEGDMLQGKWDPQEQRLHINLLEMRAVAKAFQGFSLPPEANSTGVSYINRERGTCSLSLWKETELLLQVASKLQISLWVV